MEACGGREEAVMACLPMLPCCPAGPSWGLCLAVCPSRAHTFIPHEPRAATPALAVRFLSCKQLCHNSTGCSCPLPVSENTNVSPGQRSEAFSSQSDARSFPHPVSQKALGICVGMRHNAKESFISPGRGGMIMDGWKSSLHED